MNTIFPQSSYGRLSCIYVAGKEWKKNHVLHQLWLYFELERRCDGRALLKLLLTAQVSLECGSLRDTRDGRVCFLHVRAACISSHSLGAPIQFTNTSGMCLFPGVVSGGGGIRSVTVSFNKLLRNAVVVGVF